MMHTTNASQNSGVLDIAFVRRTYVSASVLTVVVVTLLWSYRLVWAIVPVLLGVLLALVLLYASERIIPNVFRAGGRLIPTATNDAEKKKKQITPRLRRLIPIVLVKYLSVGLAAFFAVRVWQTPQLLAFCGGFLLVQLNITMRVVGRALSAGDSRQGVGNVTLRRAATATIISGQR